MSDLRLIDDLPEYYRESAEVNAIMEGHEYAINRSNLDADELLNQLFVESATWGLAIWERIFGIETILNKPIDERRYVLLAKIRGHGLLTKAKLAEIASAFYGGEVEVTDEPESYRVRVKFISNYGVPPNIDDVAKSLGEIIPAHLELVFDYTYLLIRDVNAFTLREIETKPLRVFAGGIK